MLCPVVLNSVYFAPPGDRNLIGRRVYFAQHLNVKNHATFQAIVILLVVDVGNTSTYWRRRRHRLIGGDVDDTSTSFFKA